MIARRTFLRVSAGTFTAGVLAPLTGCGGVPMLVRHAPAGRFSITLTEYRATAGDESAIAVDVGSGWPVLVGEREDGSFFALSSKCTHQACRVRPTGGALVCPCHGSAFDREGSVLRGPAQRSLAAYTATVRDAAVHVELGQ